MDNNDAILRYLAQPNTRINLETNDPEDKALLEDASKQEGRELTAKLRKKLGALQELLAAEKKRKVLIVFQAMDTGGKDGCVDNVFADMNPQGLDVKAFKKPTEEELEHDFLWRIHKHAPQNGEIMIFNRSHYEDIIAVRVKQLFPEEVWRRRIRHVIEFERMLAEEGTTIIKFFLHISKDEQKKRLEDRLKEPDKYWKFNPADLEDRKLWSHFMLAYEDVISTTSTPFAPWYIIPANRKWYRDYCVSSILLSSLQKLNMQYPPISWDPAKMIVSD